MIRRPPQPVKRQFSLFAGRLQKAGFGLFPTLSGPEILPIQSVWLLGRAPLTQEGYPGNSPFRRGWDKCLLWSRAPMIENRAVALVDESNGTANASGGRVTLRFELDIAGERLSFGVQIVRGQIRLSDIIPLARSLSEKLCQAALRKLHAEGSEVPCRKGCAACCNYLVPLSVPEAFRLQEDLSSLPVEQGRKMLHACLSAAGKILEKKPDIFTCEEPRETNGQEMTSRTSKWYAGLNLSCPFLSDNACISYGNRPIACREHFVTTPAALCVAGTTPEPSVVPMPVSILECLGQLASELEQREVEAVVLPLALPWALKNHDRSGCTWPTAMMVERFIEILKAAVAKSHTPDAVHV